MPEPVREAVILAAGRGTRLGKRGEQMPKGFLELGGTPIIEQSLLKLLDGGIEQITLVTGFMAERYDALADRVPCVRTVRNEHYAASGSMFSLYGARDLVRSDFLLLESDLIYERRALDVLQAASGAGGILLSGATNSGDEVYVEVRDGRVWHLSKNRADLGSVGGELVGISRIPLALYRRMVEDCEPLFARDRNLEYDSGCLSALAKQTEIPAIKVEDLLWAEIDDENHLKRAERDIYPGIVARDQAPHGGRRTP
jgi:choline kinase